MGPALTELTIGDDPAAWERAGFEVIDGRVTIGAVTLRFQPPGDSGRRGVIAWSFDGVDDDGSIDGMLTLDRPARAGLQPGADSDTSTSTSTDTDTDADRAPLHPNGVTGVDHVVVMTDDLDRTSAALRAFGFEPRRRREVPKSDPPRSQIFWWAGPVIIELVGPDTATGTGPATIWGLALTTTDLDAAADLLGDLMSTPKDAVQPGRRIAGLRGKPLDLSVPVALMTPHV